MTKASSSARSHGRFIPSEELGEVVQWQFGAVGSEPLTPEPALEAPEVTKQMEEDQRETEHQQALHGAFAKGKAEGEAQTALEWQQRLDAYIAGEGASVAEQWAALTLRFQQGLKEAHESMAQDVLRLASAVARQVVRTELKANHSPLQPVIAEALSELAAEGRITTVRLHPEDDATMGDALRQAFSDASVQWVVDSAMQPGGCHLEQSGKRIDASLAKRWQRALATLGLDSPWTEATGDDTA